MMFTHFSFFYICPLDDPHDINWGPCQTFDGLYVRAPKPQNYWIPKITLLCHVLLTGSGSWAPGTLRGRPWEDRWVRGGPDARTPESGAGEALREQWKCESPDRRVSSVIFQASFGCGMHGPECRWQFPCPCGTHLSVEDPEHKRINKLKAKSFHTVVWLFVN